MPTQKTTKQSDIIIVGAGVPGALLALKLAGTGLSVTVIEAAPHQTLKQALKDKTGRSVALMQAACAELRRCGVLDRLEDIICPLEGLQIIDDSYFPASSGQQERVSESFYADEIGMEAFGYNIPLNALKSAMQEALQASDNIVFLPECAVRDIDYASQNVTVTLENGQACKAALVIGADGRESVVRQQAGIAAVQRDYHTTALTCVISHSAPHDYISTEFHRPSGPFTLVPMTDSRSAVVWCEHEKDAQDFLKADRATQREALQQRSRDILGDITLDSDLHPWPLITQKAKALTAPRTALIAEAAHVLSPIGAQGMNLSLRDVEDLYEIIYQAALNGLDIGGVSTLSRYAHKRRIDMWSRGRGVDLFHRTVATSQPLMHRLRRGTLKLVSSIQPVREVLMKEGLAPRHRA